MQSNRLYVFMSLMGELLQLKISQLTQAIQGGTDPTNAETVQRRITEYYYELLVESVLHPAERQWALDAMFLVNVPQLLATPDAEIPKPPKEGVSSTHITPEGTTEE